MSLACDNLNLDTRNFLSTVDLNRIWSYDQPMMNFAWQSQTNCTNTNDTGPCYGGKANDMK